MADVAREELKGPDLKGAAVEIISLWTEAASGRGENALSWRHLKAFSEITGAVLAPEMARAVLCVDRAYLGEVWRRRAS